MHLYLIPLSANPTKWLNTRRQFVIWSLKLSDYPIKSQPHKMDKLTQTVRR